MKRIYGMILAVIILIGSLAACDMQNDETTINETTINETTINETIRYHYVSEKIFSDDIELETCAVWQNANYVYMLGFDMEAHEQILMEGNLKTREMKKIVLQMEDMQLSRVNSAYVDANGFLHTLCYTYGEGGREASGAKLCIFDTQGKLIEEKGDPSTLFSYMDLSMILSWRVVLPDDKMLFYIFDDRGKSELIMLSADAERLFEKNLGHDYVCDLRYCDNKVIILERIVANNKYRISEVDLDTGKKQVLLDDFQSEGFQKLTYGSGVDTIGIKSAEGIWSFDSEEGIKKVVSFEDARLNPTMVGFTGMLADGSLIAFSEVEQLDQNDHSHGNRNFYLLSKAEELTNDEKTKKEIVYAVFGPKEIYVGDVYAYNSASNDVKIILKTYENTDLFIQDVIAGNVPDLVDLNDEEIYRALMEKEMLEDLNPYLLQDNEISREDILDNALLFYEKDEHVYAIPYGLMVSVIMCDKQYLGQRDGWNFLEFNEFLKALPDPQMGTKAIYKREILWNLCYNYMDHFVDFTERKCAFSVEEFYDFLECANLFPTTNTEVESADSLLRGIQDGEIVMIPIQIGDVENYEFWRAQFPGEVKIIGLPSEDRSGISLIPTGWTIGMLKTCEQKNEAWDFIKRYLTNESAYVHVSAFPAYRPLFEKMMDEARQEVSRREKTKESPTITYEEIGLLEELVAIGKPITDSDDKIMQIILEEADAYFCGNKNPEQTAEIIENRVRLYLLE